MFNTGGFPEIMITRLWSECACTAVQLDNTHVIKNSITNYERYHSRKPTYLQGVRSFGEVGVAWDPNRMKKLENKGKKVM